MFINAKVKTENGETYIMENVDIGTETLRSYTDNYVHNLKNAKVLTIYTDVSSHIIPYEKVNSIEIFKAVE